MKDFMRWLSLEFWNFLNQRIYNFLDGQEENCEGNDLAIELSKFVVYIYPTDQMEN